MTGVKVMKKLILFSAVLTLILLTTMTLTSDQKKDTKKTGKNAFVQPELPYAYNALEPYIDAKTMEIHYSKHHAGYTAKLNAAAKGTKYCKMPIEQVLKKWT